MHQKWCIVQLRRYENERYEGIGIEEFSESVRRDALYGIGKEVYITIFCKENYQSNRENGLARKKEESRRINAYFGDEQDGGGNLGESGSTRINYSDRDGRRVYDIMGQSEELKKQNAKLEADVARLKERLKLERQVTKGNTFNEKQLGAVALNDAPKMVYCST